MENFDKKIWRMMFEKLYSEKTNLFYDFFVEGLSFEEFLPEPELINKQIPNPCGWCTGMEDGMINGGIMLESAIEAYGFYGNEEYFLKAKDIFKGMKKCATVSESSGFLARCLSPIDGKSHYIESSRDQYTHWIFATVKYFFSSLSDEFEKKFIKETLVKFAERARKNVIKENDYNMLREDDKKSLATKMWDVAAHEAARLPMIYLAAWKMGGDETYKADYLKYRDCALENSEKVVLPNYKRLFALHQMQLSLRFIYDFDDDLSIKGRCLNLMKKIAEYNRNSVLELYQKHKQENILQDFFKTKKWNFLEAQFWGYLDGYGYYVPKSIKSDFTCTVPDIHIYNFGDGIAVTTLVPDAPFDEEIFKVLEEIGNSIDYSVYKTDAVDHLLLPYYELKKHLPKR